MLYTGDINQMHNNNVNTSESQNKQKTCRFTDCENEPIIDPHQSTKYCDQHSCDYIINKVKNTPQPVSHKGPVDRTVTLGERKQV